MGNSKTESCKRRLARRKAEAHALGQPHHRSPSRQKREDDWHRGFAIKARNATNPSGSGGLKKTVQESPEQQAANRALRSSGGYVGITRPIQTRLHEEQMGDAALLERHFKKGA